MGTSMPRQHTGETVVGAWTSLTRASGFACTAFGQVTCILVVAGTPTARMANISKESSNGPKSSAGKTRIALLPEAVTLVEPPLVAPLTLHRRDAYSQI